ncbi:MAG: hypothetical protein JKY37_21480 [Nannocystaceae bacterium]|nr:hypothetical protein [Nannocystaceae bacterium]
MTGGVADTGIDDSTGSLFLVNPDGGPACARLPDGTVAHCTQCDTWQQDCPRGEKCMPWANDGGSSWNATRCSEIVRDPGGVGDPCTAQGSGVGGLDDCELGAMCFHVDPETNEGTCVEMCSGPSQDPICSAGSRCSITGRGVLNLCLSTCNPWLGDCDDGQVCVPNSADFSCVAQVADPVPIGDACRIINECVAGATCIDGSGSEFRSCCSPYCDLADSDPNAPCAAGQVCTAWFDAPHEAPPGFDSLGVCTVQ